MRNREQKYPDYAAEIDAIRNGGITDDLINRIIRKHAANAACSRELIARYEAMLDGVPIFYRQPRFKGGNPDEIINHRINNDFFSEIVDMKTGYFAGNPIAYSYADTREAREDTGDAGDSDAEMEAARDAASKCLTDFVARNNMFDVDMETTKYASICGYAGRLFYIDTNGEERVRVVPPDECIILSDCRDITQPTYGLRYFTVQDINDREIIKAEFYDGSTIYYAEGAYGALRIVRTAPNLYGMCPLQGIPNNSEIQGDAEKVLALIDAYDRALSDTNNEVDSFANAYMIWKNLYVEDDEKRAAQVSGSIEFHSNGQADSDVYFLTKDINDAFLEHHLDRLKENIYRFSKTPNLSDEAFGTASGVALKFKLTGLETKCGMFEAKMISAGTYMFRLLANAWGAKQIKVDPLQCCMEFKRNFPLDSLSNAQAAQAMIAAGVPKQIAWAICIPEIDDVEYAMELAESERDSIPSLTENLPEDEDDNLPDGETMNQNNQQNNIQNN